MYAHIKKVNNRIDFNDPNFESVLDESVCGLEAQGIKDINDIAGDGLDRTIAHTLEALNAYNGRYFAGGYSQYPGRTPVSSEIETPPAPPTTGSTRSLHHAPPSSCHISSRGHRPTSNNGSSRSSRPASTAVPSPNYSSSRSSHHSTSAPPPAYHGSSRSSHHSSPTPPPSYHTSSRSPHFTAPASEHGSRRSTSSQHTIRPGSQHGFQMASPSAHSSRSSLRPAPSHHHSRKSSYAESGMGSDFTTSGVECAICYEGLERKYEFSQCSHKLCGECYMEAVVPVNGRFPCPVCNTGSCSTLTSRR